MASTQPGTPLPSSSIATGVPGGLGLNIPLPEPTVTGLPTGVVAPTSTPISWFTGGWAVTVAIGASVILSGTKVAPIMAGILGVALIFQLGQLLNKPKAA